MKPEIICFERWNCEDEESANENFPNAPDLKSALEQQFLLELNENSVLKGHWEVIHSSYSEDIFLFWVVFRTELVRSVLVDELQRTYDEYGMNGCFEVVDFALIQNTIDAGNSGLTIFRDQSGQLYFIDHEGDLLFFETDEADEGGKPDTVLQLKGTYPSVTQENYVEFVLDVLTSKPRLEPWATIKENSHGL